MTNGKKKKTPKRAAPKRSEPPSALASKLAFDGAPAAAASAPGGDFAPEQVVVYVKTGLLGRVCRKAGGGFYKVMFNEIGCTLVSALDIAPATGAAPKCTAACRGPN